MVEANPANDQKRSGGGEAELLGALEMAAVGARRRRK